MTSPLHHDQAAQVDLGELGLWGARVVRVAGQRLALAFDDAAPDGLADLGGTSLHLSVATPRGILQTPATVVGVGPTGLLELKLLAEGRLDQRRDHVRVEGRLPGVVERRDASVPPLHTYTLDVSGGGLLVAGIGPAEDGDRVVVTVKLPDREPLRVEGRVARRTAEGHAGLVLEGITPADRQELVRWIFERQRLERAAAQERR